MLTRWMAITDTHGDKADGAAVEAAFHFAKTWKPTVRLHMGDAFDFRWLRSKASATERAEDVKADIDAGLDLLKRWKPTHYLWGNHEKRLVVAMESNEGETRAFACEVSEKIDKAVGPSCKQFQYSVRDGIVKIGDHRFIHGYSAGVHAARVAAQHFGNVLMGHTHTVDMVEVAHCDEPCTGHTIGCLCDLNMQYALDRLATLRWGHGFAYGTTNTKTGRTWVWQARKRGSEWNFPSEHASSAS